MDLIVLPTVDSTNDYIRKLSSASNLANGTAVLAFGQSNGRGQRGNRWLSLPGDGLYLSVYYRSSALAVDKSVLVSKAMACALHEYLLFRAGAAFDVRIKWPNDVLADQKKIAGLLIENSLRGSIISEVIAGVGVNLNQKIFNPKDFNAPPVSLFQLTGLQYDPETEAGRLKAGMDHWMDLLLSNRIPEIENYYSEVLFRKNEIVCFESEQTFVKGLFSGVDETGAAILISGGEELRLNHPEYRMKMD